MYWTPEQARSATQRISQIVPTTVTETLQQIVAAYIEELGCSAVEINDGSCWEVMDELQRLFPDGESCNNRELGDPNSNWDHGFFYRDGLYYDSEATKGVEDWTQLPCCKRQMS